uniref:Uncharacterized protein n=1 Tax=Manihot esculenta TaxID=3983 RepID=A0A2C9VPL5_MANES
MIHPSIKTEEKRQFFKFHPQFFIAELSRFHPPLFHNPTRIVSSIHNVDSICNL